jgi:hypothetical protein
VCYVRGGEVKALGGYKGLSEESVREF